MPPKLRDRSERLTDRHGRPERLLSLAVPAHHPELPGDAIVGPAGVDRETRQQQDQLEILQV